MNAHKHIRSCHKCVLSSLKCAVLYIEGYEVVCIAHIPPYKQLYLNLDCLHVVTFIRSLTVEYICPAGATHPRSKLNALLPLAS